MFHRIIARTVQPLRMLSGLAKTQKKTSLTALSKFGKQTKVASEKVLNVSTVLILALYGLGGAAPSLIPQAAVAAAPPGLYVSLHGTGDCSTLADACGSINQAISLADPTGGTVIHVSAGTYTEDVTINRPVTLVGAGMDQSIIQGQVTGSANTVTVSSNNVTVEGFTITRAGNDVADWNTNTKTNGVSFNGVSNSTLEDSKVTGNRNGVYFNNAQNITVANNIVTDNRTGFNLVNNIDGAQITGNIISDNWTLGLLYYGLGGGTTNFSTLSVTGNTFDQNWWTEVEVRDTGTGTGTLDVTNNTFSDSPVTYTTSSDPSLNEPGYSTQIPVEFRGAATQPVTPLPTLRTYDNGSVILKHTPKTLRVGATEPYTTIQSAIDDASNGDTIAVDQGTYNESVNVNKSLTIEGAQSGVAGADSNGIQRSGSESTVTGQLNITVSNVSVNGFSFTNGGPQVNITSPSTLSGVTVEDNIFSGYGSVGLPTSNAGNLSIMGNFFTNPLSSTESIQVKADSDAGGCDGTNVSNNVFVGASNNGGADINFSCTGSDSSNVTVSGNTDMNNTGGTSFTALSGITDGIHVTDNHVTGSSGSAIFFWGGVTGSADVSNNIITGGASKAINVEDEGSTYGGVNTGTFTIDNNDLSGNDRSIYLGSGAFDNASTVTAHGNNLSGDTTAGFENDSTATTALAADGTSNWWGAANGPYDNVPGDGSTAGTNAGSGTIAIGAVKYSPWCTVAGCSIDSTTVPAQPTSLSAKFQYDSSDVANNSYLSVASKSGGNNLELLWDAPSGWVTGYHVLATYPDGSTHTFYQGANTNAWLATYDGFGQNGQGQYTYQVVAVNPNGDSTASDPFTLYYDNTKPTVAFTAPTPANNAYVNSDFSVGYTAHDNVALKSVNVSLYDTDPSHSNHWVATCYSNSSETGTDDSGTCAVHLPVSLPDGTYYIQVGAQDQAGNWSVNATRTINVDRTAPGIPTAAFTADNTGKVVDNGGATNSKNFTFNLSNPGLDGVVHYQLKYWNDISGSPYDGEANAWSPTDLSSYSSSLGVYNDQFTQGDGTHYFAFSACDAAGNCSAYSAPFTITYDTTRPNVSFVSPTDFSGLLSPGPNVTVDASDPGSGLSTLVIHVYNSSNTLLGTCGTATAAELSAGSMSCDLSGLSNGVYYIKVGAFDNAGNNTTISSGNFTIDNNVLAAPVLTSPGDGAVVNGAILTNSWGSVANGDKYEYESFNSSNTSATPRYDATYPGISKTATNVADGTVFYWRVRAIDQYGQTGPWSNGGSLWEVTVDNVAPVVAITAPSGGANLRGTVTVSGTVTDANPDHYYLVVKDSHGNVVAGPGTVYTANVADYRWDTTGVADGTYTIDLEARDAASNKGSNSTQTIQVTVDNTAPTTPTASPGAGTYTSTQLVSLTSSDSGSGVADIYYTTDGTTPNNTGNGTRYTGAISVSGSETIEAIAYDNAGNASTVFSGTYTITPPVVTTIVGGGGLGAAFVATTSAGGGTTTGGGTAGTTGTGGTSGTQGQVLGASTGPSSSTGNHNNSNGNAGNPQNQNSFLSNFEQFGWWLLLLILIILGGGWGYRRYTQP